MLIFVCSQEMTLDEYEAMMAEKQPKINKEAAKPKASFVTCRSVCYYFCVAGKLNFELLNWLAFFGKINRTCIVCKFHICQVE